MRVVLTAIATLATLAYPFLWWIFHHSESAMTQLAIAMAGLWTMRGALNYRDKKETAYFAFCVAGLFLATAILRRPNLMLWYPVAINAIFLAAFLHSLWHTPMIERFARMRHAHLPAIAIPYLRRITHLWCVYFTVNMVITIALIGAGNHSLWAVYTGIISYLLMGLLFIAEYAYRTFILKPHHHED